MRWAGLVSDVLSVHSHAPAGRSGLARQHRRTGTVAKQAGADQHAGVVVKVHGRAADLDADRQHMLTGAAGQQRAAERKIGQRGSAALPHQIKGLHIGAQPETFDDMPESPGHT